MKIILIMLNSVPGCNNSNENEARKWLENDETYRTRNDEIIEKIGENCKGNKENDKDERNEDNCNTTCLNFQSYI